MKQASLTKETFGTLPSGDLVEAIFLSNRNGVSARIITYGASIQSVCVPDRDGNFTDVTAGYSTLAEYIEHPQFFGATVGRVANRISNARFVLDGENYTVPANDSPHSLHGGLGFDKVNWVVTQCDEDNLSVTLRHISPYGDQGYPGTLTATATYSLDDNNSLTVRYEATTDAPTMINLSNHAYWNLGGEGTANGAMNHILVINADHFLPVDARLIPSGERREVEGTRFDFRHPTVISTHISDISDEQIGFGHGYDHNWIISETPSSALRAVAFLEDPHSGRTMTLLSNQPGLQFYSGNFFDGTTSGKLGRPFMRGDYIALEPQQFPDAPNQPSFSSIQFNPGELYSNVIIWHFGTKEQKH